MTFFCFIDLEGSSTPHMEPLDATDLAAAEQEARTVLRRHASGRTALVRWHDEPVFILSRDSLAEEAQGAPAWRRQSPVRSRTPPLGSSKRRRPLFG